jgi:hypothetical protein
MAHSNNKKMATASLSTEILASFTACTHQLEVAISCISYLMNGRPSVNKI